MVLVDRVSRDDGGGRNCLNPERVVSDGNGPPTSRYKNDGDATREKMKDKMNTINSNCTGIWEAAQGSPDASLALVHIAIVWGGFLGDAGG